MTRLSSAGAASTSIRCACGRRARSTRCASTLSIRAIMSARSRTQARAEAISKVLYPSDATPAGQELRLRQEYFFASASLQDLMRRHVRQTGDIHRLADKVAIQLNDTHPAIGVAELMRLLVDVHGVEWKAAWKHHPGDVLLHQSHASAGGARKLAGCADGAAAAAPHADHLSDQRHASRRSCARRARATRRRSPQCRSSTSTTDGACAWAIWRFVGSHKVNGVSALHTDAGQGDGVPRFPSALSRIASSTRPTASPSAAGCSRPIRG